MRKCILNISGLLGFCLLLLACNKNQDLTGSGNNSGNNNNNGNTGNELALQAGSGYATQNGGTNGGGGGILVTATNFTQLKQYLESTTTNYVVKVTQTIYNGEKGGSIRVANNKTLVGVGNQAFLDGIGLSIINARNVIIRNVRFSMVSITNRTDPAVYDIDGDEGRPQIIVNGGDCVSIDGGTNIWIDHCEFSSENPAVQTNQDLYDGLVDIKGNSAFITLSWNYFHDHHKTHLVGSSDSDNYDRRITWHHNHYSNIKSRLPLYRYGTGHFVNNYLVNIGSGGCNSRNGACLKVESNVFETVRNPIVSDGNPAGQFQLTGNLSSNITGTAFPATSTCTASIPYNFVADAASDVKAKVLQGAGVGKL